MCYNNPMKILFALLQCTWGILQTFCGFIVFLLHIKNQHFLSHGSVVTRWKRPASASLGLFIFVADDPYPYLKEENLSRRLLVHEYGHTVQSLLLGPLYLPVIFLPSCLWAGLPRLCRKRREKRISYFSFYTERWANRLGERLLKERSMENLLID